MNRNDVEQEGRRLLALRREREEIGVVTDMSLNDKKKAIAALPRKLRAEALGEAQTLLGRLSPGDELRLGDVQNLVAAVVAEQVFTLLGEALEAAPADSHGRYDLAFVTRRRKELDTEITRLESDLKPHPENKETTHWPKDRISNRLPSWVAFDTWTNVDLPSWSLEGWLNGLPAGEPEETKRGPGRPRKILSGFRERESEEAPI